MGSPPVLRRIPNDENCQVPLRKPRVRFSSNTAPSARRPDGLLRDRHVPHSAPERPGVTQTERHPTSDFCGEGIQRQVIRSGAMAQRRRSLHHAGTLCFQGRRERHRPLRNCDRQAGSARVGLAARPGRRRCLFGNPGLCLVRRYESSPGLYQLRPGVAAEHAGRLLGARPSDGSTEKAGW